MEVKSAGTVVFRKNTNGNLFLLLHYQSGHWDFIKGKIEQGETPQQTTTREAMEETGISDLEFIDGFEETIEYDFQYDGNHVHKKVVFFLAKTNTEKITISHEHLEYLWLDFDKAIEKTTFQNAKSVLSKANKLLAKSF